MLTAKKIDNYFQRESQQTANKRKSERKKFKLKNTEKDSSIKNSSTTTPHFGMTLKKNFASPLSQNSGSAPDFLHLMSHQISSRYQDSVTINIQMLHFSKEMGGPTPCSPISSPLALIPYSSKLLVKITCT